MAEPAGPEFVAKMQLIASTDPLLHSSEALWEGLAPLPAKRQFQAIMSLAKTACWLAMNWQFESVNELIQSIQARSLLVLFTNLQLAKLAEEPGRVKEIVADACALTQLVMTNPSMEKFPRQAKVRWPATIVWFVVQFR